LINEGNMRFKLQPLTGMAQLSPIFGCVIDDLDRDGILDIFGAGNFYDVKPDLGRMDARAAYFLKGNGNGGFEFIPDCNARLGFPSQFRDVLFISGKGKKKLVLAANNGPLLILQVE
jgi:enediyne biosynthesis protein E4